MDKVQNDYAKVSLTNNGEAFDFNHMMTDDWDTYNVYINARINEDPSIIKASINRVLARNLNYAV